MLQTSPLLAGVGMRRALIPLDLRAVKKRIVSPLLLNTAYIIPLTFLVQKSYIVVYARWYEEGELIYLDNAATSRYKPRSVLRAQYLYTARSANAGRGGYRASIDLSAKIEDIREELSRDFSHKKVIFTKNCTEATNMAIFGMGLRGEVLVSEYEHNSVLRPLKKLENTKEIRMRFLTSSGKRVTSEMVADAITRETRAVFCTHISNVTGVVNDVEGIAEETARRGIVYVCDMAQSMGHVHVDSTNIDVITASGHKGLHAPQGTGLLLYNGSKLDISPLLYGGTGSSTLDLVQPHIYPEGLESGTLNAAGIIALGNGYRWTKAHAKQIYGKIHKLSSYLIRELRRIAGVVLLTQGDYSPSGVVAFNLKGIPSTTVADVLDSDYNIAVRAGLHCAPYSHVSIGSIEGGAVRASVGYNNTKRDIDRLIVALQEIWRENRQKS